MRMSGRHYPQASGMATSIRCTPFELCQHHVVADIFFYSIVNNEPLELSAVQRTALCGGQLQTCDLRGSGIQACGTCLVG